MELSLLIYCFIYNCAWADGYVTIKDGVVGELSMQEI